MSDRAIRQLRAELDALRVRIDALERGRRALDAGRAEAIRKAKNRGAESGAMVLEHALADMRAGKAARGRAGRIAVALKGALSVRQVKRILDTLSSASDSPISNTEVAIDEDAHRERAA